MSSKYYVVCIMGIISFLVLPLILNTYYILPAFAAESSPSADIKAKLEELKKEIASKAAKLKQEVNRKLKDKAYVGKIQSKSTTSLNLTAKSGPKTVSLNQDTIYESSPKKKTLTLRTLKEEDYIAALGDIDERGVLIARKIILLPPPKVDPLLAEKTYLWGQVISISDKLITLKNRESKNVSVALPNIPAVKLNDFVILSGTYTKSKIFEAKFVYVIPQGGIIKPKKSATPSAKISSPSAKPKSTSR